MSKSKKSKKFVLILSIGWLAGLGMTPAFGQIASQGTVIQTPQPVAPAVVGLHQIEDAALAAKPVEKAGKAATNAGAKAGVKAGAGKAKASKAKSSKTKSKAVSSKQAAKGKKAAAGSGKSGQKKSQQAATKRKKAR